MPSGRAPSPATIVAAGARPPAPLTRIVGRERELDELETLFASSRLVTLTGVGGGGKTRLAAELARRAADARATAWVELATCPDAQLVAQYSGAAFGLRETTDRETLAALVDFLRDRDALLVLDNCEHVIDACAELATAILTKCPLVTMLTTSREPLGITGERIWPVPPLAVPDADAGDERTIGSAPAAELFLDRARAADPSFALTSENAAAVVSICRRLDGIPLAIELAAARIRHLTAGQIASRLDDRFALLAAAPRSGVPRHRTLRATIDWSFALLGAKEQRLLERLAVFSGSFSLEAVEAVCCDATLPAADVLDLLGALVDKSLVVRAGSRFALLETIARYAAEQLAPSADADAFHRRHAEAFLTIARDAGHELSIASTAALERLDAEQDNFRAALAWSIENEPDSLGLPLCAALRWYWYYAIRWREGARWLTRALDRATVTHSRDFAAVLTARGTLGAYLGEVDAARIMLTESLDWWRELRDERELAFNLSALAQLLATSGDLALSGAYAGEAVALARKGGVAWDLGYVLTNAAAFLAQFSGDFEAADRHLAEAEAIWSDPKHPLGLPFARNARAMLALRRRDNAAALRHARAALLESRERHELWFSSRSLRIIAFTSSSDPERAARLLGAATCMLQTTTAGMLLHERAEYDQLLESIHRQLGPEAAAAALREGQSMSFDDACALALEEDGASSAGAVSAVLRVRDLGALQITLDGRPLEGDARASARAREMLVFLLAQPGGRTKEEAGVALWPDASAGAMKNSFHVTLHRLRKMLGSSDAVISRDARYTIGGDVTTVVASREFERRVTAALRGDDLAELDAALALYEGDFLQGEEAGEWCLPIRAHLRQLYLRALFAAGQKLEARGRYEEAAERYRLIAAREPFHEAALRQLMICRARLGLRSESLLVYRDLEQRLREELESAPEPETAALYRRLRENEGV